MSLIRKVLKSGFLILTSLLIPLLLIEGVLEVTKINATSANTLPVTLSNQIVTRTPNTNFRWAWGPFGEINILKTVNNYGFVSHRDFMPNADTEKVALVGGSWIEAMQTSMAESIGFQLDNVIPGVVYPISASEPNLAQNLGLVKLAIDTLKVDKAIIVFANTNLAHALTDRRPGKRIFDKDGGLTIASDFVPSLTYRLLTSTNIANYLFKNLEIQKIISGKDTSTPQSPNMPTSDPKTEKTVDTAIKFFIDGLKDTGFASDNMLFVFVPNFSALVQSSADSTVFKFKKLDVALSNAGYITYDLHSAFSADLARNHQDFLIPKDSHWNSYAQALAARLIANHPVLSGPNTAEN